MPVPSTTLGPSTQPSDESGIVRQLRSRISEMEKNLSTIYAGVAVVKKKGELAMKLEKYARDELVKATKSLQCK